ncbi:MAG: protein phosphatase 2C domain-containing protein, partial [Oscillospiraceae bacterium]|nr:protein phosphatase 2C domain-containing protein [Oscillospiraceae bacterium]
MIINSAKYSCAAGHEINEDSCLCSAERGIFIVADGLGGHSDGEKASLAAVDYFEENCLGGYTSERISELLEGANTEVIKKGDGGKTTVAAAFTENGNFIYANAGDSRVYYFRDGKIIAQTKDHSVCQASVDMGMIRPEDIRGNEDRSRLLKVLGSEEKLNIKKSYPPIKIQNGDAFWVCSDGFWEYVYETEMEADLLKSDSSEAWLKYMLKRHILRAENKGDNYTAVCGIIYLDGSESFEGSPALVTDGSKGKRFVPLLIAGTAAIAAAIALSVFLRSGNDGGTVT